MKPFPQPQERTMHTYLVTFADGLTSTVKAFDRDGAQESAIEHMEDAGIPHCAIVSIRRI